MVDVYYYEHITDKTIQEKYKNDLLAKIKQSFKQAKTKKQKIQSDIFINECHNKLYALESNLIHKDFLKSLSN